MARRRATHRAISKPEWLASQQRQLTRWHDSAATLEAQRQLLHERYFSAIQRLLPELDADSEIVEIGSGPACFCREIPVGHKTLIDPLLDDVRRIHPGALPKDAVYINRAAESIPLPSHCVDLVICMNVLSFSLNPEEILHEIARLLKPEATALLAVQISSPLAARLHYAARNLLPFLRDHTRPYRFCQRAMEHTISRHLTIDEQITIVRRPWYHPFGDDELLFACTPQPEQ